MIPLLVEARSRKSDHFCRSTAAPAPSANWELWTALIRTATASFNDSLTAVAAASFRADDGSLRTTLIGGSGCAFSHLNLHDERATLPQS